MASPTPCGDALRRRPPSLLRWVTPPPRPYTGFAVTNELWTRNSRSAPRSRAPGHASHSVLRARRQSRLDAVAAIDGKGAGIIVRAGAFCDANLTLESIRSQSVQPQAIAIVYSHASASGERSRPGSPPDENIVSLHRPHCTGADA